MSKYNLRGPTVFVVAGANGLKSSTEEMRRWVSSRLDAFLDGAGEVES
jgi:hypothetical protein